MKFILEMDSINANYSYCCFTFQGIYSCFNGVEDISRSASIQNPDVTANYAQANMLKMLRTAKDIVSSTKVENSLDNATKTIENWSRHGGSLPARIPQVTTTEKVPGHFSYLTNITENHIPHLQHSITPPFAQHNKTTSPPPMVNHRVLTRPTPLRYTLPARTRGLYDGMLPVSSLSTPHLAMHDLHSDPAHTGSSFVPYRDLQVPDIYTEHHRQKKRAHNLLIESMDLRGLHDYKDHMTRADANDFGENNLSSLYSENPFTSADTAYNSCIKTYLDPVLDNIPLIGKRKLHRRPSFLKATWGPDRVWFPGDRPSAAPSSRATIPDLFPCVDVHGRVRKNTCFAQPVDHTYPHPFRRHTRKTQKLRHSQSTRLPSYMEAVFHNPAVVRRASSMVHRPYSYPELPIYQSPLPYGPAELCNIFPCMGHPADNVSRGYRAPTHLQDDHLVPVPGSRVVHGSPIVPMSWGRISSLESEV